MKFPAFLAILLSGCVSLNSVSLTQIPKERKNRVHSEASKFIIFGFTFSNSFADEVVPDLARQCKGGMVQGILTKDEAVNYFIGLVVKQRIQATGYCNKSKSA